MVKKTMNAAILDKPFSIDVNEIKIPVPKKNEALVRVRCIGICGSDVHYYEYGKIGRYVVKQPLILGHELAGDVVEVGADVKDVVPGDRVAVEPGVICGTCDFCKSGRYNLCPDVEFMATPPIDGAWAEYVTVRSDFLHKLPDSLSYEEGALLEPLSVGFHALNRANVKPFDRILVTGLGPIGLLTIKAAQAYGVNEIYASDVVPYRLQKAKELGVTATINPLEDSVEAFLTKATDHKGVDVVVETSGNSKVISSTIELVKRGGRVVLVGLPTTEKTEMNISHFIDSEIDLYGVFRYANTYPSAIQALKGSSHNIEDVITHKYSLCEIKEAVELARTDKGSSIKIMIYPSGVEE